MPNLLPFRPWTFANGDTRQISALKEPERKADDRSPFVRYARSAALWAEWVREGVVVQASEPFIPTKDVNGFELTFGILPIEALEPTMSVPPSGKEHLQRLLEGVQLYVDPILVLPMESGKYKVVGNHELFEAAKAYRDDMARPGRVRSSDHCLVAVVNEEFLSQIGVQDRVFVTNKDEEAIEADIQSIGFAGSPRADDPSKFSIQIGSKSFNKAPEKGSDWQVSLAQALGIRTLDLSSNTGSFESNSSGKKIVLTSPPVTKRVLELGILYPFGSLTQELDVVSGAIMWSLRDFQTE